MGLTLPGNHSFLPSKKICKKSPIILRTLQELSTTCAKCREVVSYGRSSTGDGDLQQVADDPGVAQWTQDETPVYQDPTSLSSNSQMLSGLQVEQQYTTKGCSAVSGQIQELGQ